MFRLKDCSTLTISSIFNENWLFSRFLLRFLHKGIHADLENTKKIYFPKVFSKMLLN